MNQFSIKCQNTVLSFIQNMCAIDISLILADIMFGQLYEMKYSCHLNKLLNYPSRSCFLVVIFCRSRTPLGMLDGKLNKHESDELNLEKIMSKHQPNKWHKANRALFQGQKSYFLPATKNCLVEIKLKRGNLMELN